MNRPLDYRFINGELKPIYFDDLCLQEKINRCCSRGHSKARNLRKTRKLFDEFYINNLTNGMYCYFVSFTFKDTYTIDNYSIWNRKQFTDYLRRGELESKFTNFILFADFGSSDDFTKRFHLHGICSSMFELDIKHCDYFNRFGFTKFDVLNDSNKDYIVKYSVKFLDNFSFRRILVNNVKFS